jgi:hypothetical protein
MTGLVEGRLSGKGGELPRPLKNLTGPEPQTNALHLIRLIQTRHQEFKLDGGERMTTAV